MAWQDKKRLVVPRWLLYWAYVCVRKSFYPWELLFLRRIHFLAYNEVVGLTVVHLDILQQRPRTCPLPRAPCIGYIYSLERFSSSFLHSLSVKTIFFRFPSSSLCILYYPVFFLSNLNTTNACAAAIPVVLPSRCMRIHSISGSAVRKKVMQEEKQIYRCKRRWCYIWRSLWRVCNLLPSRFSKRRWKHG